MGEVLDFETGKPLVEERLLCRACGCLRAIAVPRGEPAPPCHRCGSEAEPLRLEPREAELVEAVFKGVLSILSIVGVVPRTAKG